jgi:CRISPR-associated protein (TIGR02710 family)
VKSLLAWQPVRVVFVCSADSRLQVADQILLRARERGLDVDPGRYDISEIGDPSDLPSCLTAVRDLTEKVQDWMGRGHGFEVIVDITGGTKCMAAALAIQAARWPCTLSYVSGERDKGGLGVVVSGTERVVSHWNPWDDLGYQATEEFAVLFDQRDYPAAARSAEAAKTRARRDDARRELAALENLARGFAQWDHFDHKGAATRFADVQKAANDLRGALGRSRADRILNAIPRWLRWLQRLADASAPHTDHVVDLLANAGRRRDEARFDDAVARLYRAVEALAQVRLRETYGIATTAEVSLERLPEPLATRWAPRASEGVVKLGLQDAYALLAARDDPVGRRFCELGLDGPESPLIARNASILAHGFERVSQPVFDRLWDAAFDLLRSHDETAAGSLPSFPRLGGAGGRPG